MCQQYLMLHYIGPEACQAASKRLNVQLGSVAGMLGLGVAYVLWSWRRMDAATRYLVAEYRHFRDSGLTVPLSSRRRPARGDFLDRRIEALTSVTHQLRDLHRFVSDSLNGLPDATLVCDTEQRIALANAAAARHFSSICPAPARKLSPKRRPSCCARCSSTSWAWAHRAWRRGVPVTVVSNSYLRVPEHLLIERVVVGDGFDAADDWIAERAGVGDVVITADIPLADRCLKAGAQALKSNGQAFTPDSIGSALAGRMVGEHLRQVRAQQRHAEVLLHDRHGCTAPARSASSFRC